MTNITFVRMPIAKKDPRDIRALSMLRESLIAFPSRREWTCLMRDLGFMNILDVKRAGGIDIVCLAARRDAGEIRKKEFFA
jgi:hypothetical protein